MENKKKIKISKDQVNLINQDLADPLFIIELLTKRLISNDKLDWKTQREIQMIAKQSDKILKYVSTLAVLPA